MNPRDGGQVATRITQSERLEKWGPVCRGFVVRLPDGQRGSVQNIRLGERGIEFLVEIGLFVRRGLIVGANEIDAILPPSYEIVVRSAGGDAARPSGGDVEEAGGIVRMPMRHPSHSRKPREAA
jgi:hypothetical protein